MSLDNPQAVAADVLNTTSGLGSARTVPTGVRFYASGSNDVGYGLVNAERAVTGSQTTIMSGAAMATSVLLGGSGAAYYLSQE